MSHSRRHSGVVSDTDAAVLRQMTITERLEFAFRLHDRIRAKLPNAIRNSHPEWKQQQVWRETARKIADDELDDIPPVMRYYTGE